MDEFALEGPPAQHGLFAINGVVRVDGEAAGLTEGFYLLDDEPASDEAFLTLWDMEDWTCEIYEELMERRRVFRQPLPRLLARKTGLLYLGLIALKPSFRARGLGRRVLERWIGNWCDPEVGAVVIDARPLQRREEGYDAYDDEVRDLPWESPGEDDARLAKHLRDWGFHRVAGTRFMVASPAWLGISRAKQWPPVEIEDDEPWDDGDEPWNEDDVPF